MIYGPKNCIKYILFNVGASKRALMFLNNSHFTVVYSDSRVVVFLLLFLYYWMHILIQYYTAEYNIGIAIWPVICATSLQCTSKRPHKWLSINNNMCVYIIISTRINVNFVCTVLCYLTLQYTVCFVKTMKSNGKYTITQICIILVFFVALAWLNIEFSVVKRTMSMNTCSIRN